MACICYSESSSVDPDVFKVAKGLVPFWSHNAVCYAISMLEHRGSGNPSCCFIHVLNGHTFNTPAKACRAKDRTCQ